MRAFMSDPSDEPHDETVPGAYMAVREARAILAETEPPCGCAFDHLYGRCAGAYMTLSETRAFVGEAGAPRFSRGRIPRLIAHHSGTGC